MNSSASLVWGASGLVEAILMILEVIKVSGAAVAMDEVSVTTTFSTGSNSEPV